MASNNARGLPPGMRDEARRVVTNKVMQDKGVFEKYGAETNGEYMRSRVTVRPGGGVPLHYHTTFTESFEPVKGTLGVVLGQETLHLEAGESRTVPRNTIHRFFNDGDEDVEFMLEARPAHQGFEQTVYIFYGLANDGLTDDKGFPDFVKLCLLTEMGEMYFPGLTGVALNLFTTVGAAYGRWMGVEEELLQRYWDS